MKKQQRVAVLGLLLVALFRIVAPEQLDELVVALLVGAVVIAVVPISSLKSFKAAGIELTVGSPQLKAAVGSLDLDRLNDERLTASLKAVADLLPIIRGARVLWIDDRPDKVLGERRIMRALGVTIVAVGSSEKAKITLEEDSDFDLLISDVQRRGTTHETTGGKEKHEGVNFVRWLRENHHDEAVRNLPVVFYAAYDWQRLVKFTRPARELEPEADISNSVVDMVPKVIRRLAETRSAPISAPSEKVPTRVRDIVNPPI